MFIQHPNLDFSGIPHVLHWLFLEFIQQPNLDFSGIPHVLHWLFLEFIQQPNIDFFSGILHVLHWLFSDSSHIGYLWIISAIIIRPFCNFSKMLSKLMTTKCFQFPPLFRVLTFKPEVHLDKTPKQTIITVWSKRPNDTKSLFGRKIVTLLLVA